MPESPFIKVAGVWRRYFPVNFAKFLRTPFERTAPGDCFCPNKHQKEIQTYLFLKKNKNKMLLIIFERDYKSCLSALFYFTAKIS